MGSLVEIPQRKRLVRRAVRDRSQAIRIAVQYSFLALNLWIGFQFYGFVRYCESAGTTTRYSRPPGVEGWLPIASLMNLKYLVITGHFPQVLCAGMLLLVAFLAISLLLRKAFCGWLCPVGTVSELLWKAGRKMFGRSVVLPRWWDLPLRGLKYLLMGLFLFVVGSMSSEGIEGFLGGPYGTVADVRMLNFFRYIGGTAGAVLIVLAALSLFIQNFWCRYLCPYGALMGLAGLLSPTRIIREEGPCIDCGKCSKACPAQLPVDQLVQIRSAECMACMECVAVCPAEGALGLSIARRKVLRPVWVAAGIVALFVGTVAYGKISGHWWPKTAEQTYMELVGRAQEISHP